MASAGTVTIDFAAETAKFTAELKKIRDDLRGLKGDVENISGFFSNMKSVFGGVLSVGALVGGIKAVIDATKEHQQAVIEMESALANAGETAGLTTTAFQEFAEEIMFTSTLSDEAALRIQAILLSFRAMSGETVLRATQAVADFSARMKVDLTQAARTVGRALANPEKGISLLRRVVGEFTPAQRQLIEQFQEMGKITEAQGVILGRLEESFAGAALAARQTFTGALQAVSVAVHELMEIDAGLPGVVKGLNEIADLLKDEQFTSNIDRFLGFFFKLGAVWLEAAAKVGVFLGKLQEVVDFITTDLPLAMIRFFDSVEEFIEEGLPGRLGKRVWEPVFNSLFDAARAPFRLLLEDVEEVAVTAQKIGQAVVPNPVAENASFDFRAARAQEELLFIHAAQTKIDEAVQEHVDAREKAEIESERRKLEISKQVAEERLRVANETMRHEFDLAMARGDMEEELLQEIQDLRVGAMNAGIDLLRTYASESSTAAKLLIAVEKGLAIAQVIMATRAAAGKALAIYGPTPKGYAAAAAAIAFGALQVAAIAATGFRQAGQVAPGGALPGTVANPIITEPAGVLSSDRGVVHVTFNGPVFNTDETERWLRNVLADLADRDVVFFGSGTAQGDVLNG